MSISTTILCRVQARDGMFLGPDSFGGAVITIKDVVTQKVLATGFTDTGNSGSRLTSYASNVSPAPIVTPGTPNSMIYWVAAATDTVKFEATIKLTDATLLDITARIPLPKEQGDQFVQATEWVIPGKDLTVGAGFVLEAPGLWVQPEIVSNKTMVRVRAKVTMMCGCEINNGAPWIPEDFEVTVLINSEEGSFEKTSPMSFEDNSQFFIDVTLPKKGNYTAEIQAFQISTANTGVARTSFSV